jgi:ectoine hydroxylase-related dioxygenase (phytanoyl-CoA dioxygenase family)
MNPANGKTIKEMTRQFEEDGYLYLKGFLDEGKVKQGLEIITAKLISSGHAMDTNLTISDWSVLEGKVSQSPNMLSQQEWIQDQPELQEILQDDSLKELLQEMTGKECFPIPFKWLRAVGTGLFTGLHNDHVYVGHIDPSIITCWLPISSVPISRGSLVVCPKSHKSAVWQDLYENNSTAGLGNGTTSGWLTTDPNTIPIDSQKYVTTDFKPGDIVLLDLKTIHMTARNTTNQWRISCDVRWVPMTVSLES